MAHFTANDMDGVDDYKYWVIINLVNNCLRKLTQEPPEEWWTIEDVANMSLARRAEALSKMLTGLELSISVMEAAQRISQRSRPTPSRSKKKSTSILQEFAELSGISDVYWTLFGD